MAHVLPQDQLAFARERFLTSEKVAPPEVRQVILTSWLRSRSWHVSPSSIALPYVKDPNQETLLAQTSAPILRQLRDELGDEPVSIILTDADGVVLQRLTGDTTLERYLDRVQLAPGFSYSEQFVGTNGIGSALENKEPFQVFGHEHYAENLERLACAGVPICHPTTGRVLGLLDLTCWTRDSGPLLVALAKATSRRIEKTLLKHTGLRELALFREYLRTCNHTPGPVLAVNDDVVMMNEPAQQQLAPADQSMLLGYASDAVDSARQHSFNTELPSGALARVSCRPVWGESGLAGGVVHIRLSDTPPRLPNWPLPTPNVTLPGIAGSAAGWRRCCQDLSGHFRSGDWLAVEGEPGTGKLALLRAVHRAHRPADRLRVMDALDCTDPAAWTRTIAQELAGGTGTLVLRHLDRLSPDGLGLLADVLAETPDSSSGPWLAATVKSAADPKLADVLGYFPRTQPVPPLRHHAEDIRELVPYLLGELTHGGELSLSAEATQLLMRNPWPGNIAQLRHSLAQAAQRRRSGTIGVDELPPECRATTSRRVLTPLEALERDAIVQSLQDNASNKKQAAEALGMSRATIYRKIRDYGIPGR